MKWWCTLMTYKMLKENSSCSSIHLITFVIAVVTRNGGKIANETKRQRAAVVVVTKWENKQNISHKQRRAKC